MVGFLGLDVRKPSSGGLRTTLRSAFVIRVLESFISKLATSEISILRRLV